MHGASLLDLVKNNAAAFFTTQVNACPLFPEALDKHLSSNFNETQDSSNERSRLH